MKLAALTISAGLVLAGDPSIAAKRTITWDDEMCSNSLEFDDTKYDETTLRNTIGLLFGMTPPVEAPSVEGVFKPEDVAKLDLDRLQAACTDALARAQGTAFLALPEIKTYWATKVDEIRDMCVFQVAKVRAYRDPGALREYTPAMACSRYVDALEGKTDLAQIWRNTIAESCRQNADPARCTSSNLADGSRPNGQEWIRLYVMEFGWNNCAVKYLKVNTAKTEGQRTALQQRFKRLFKIKKQGCDEGAAD
jgi:hypothetical protein